MTITPPTVQDLLKKYPGLISASANISDSQLKASVTKSSALDKPEQGSIIFLNEVSQLQSVIYFKPQILVLPQNTGAEVLKDVPPEILVLLSPSPKLAMALLNKDYFSYNRIDGHFDFAEALIHPTAMIHSTAALGQNVKVGPYAVIGAHVKIGSDTKIASHAVIESESEIGNFCQIFSNTTIGWKSKIGNFCVIQSGSTIGSDGFGYATDEKGAHHSIPHQGRVVLGDHVHVGSGSQIDRGTYGDTVVGEQTKIDNLVHIAHNCKIGKSCFLTAGFMIAGSSEVGDFFIAGGATVVTGHIKVTNNVQVAGVSVVHRSIDKPGSYGGYPLVPLKDHLRNLTSIAKISDLRKQLEKLIKGSEKKD